MSGENNYVLPFRISTDELPEKDRLAIWTEVFGRGLIKVDFEAIPDAPFSQTATVRGLPGLSMISGVGGGYRASRMGSLIAEGSDDFFLQIHLQGAGQLSQLGRDAVAGSGEAVLLSGEDASSARMPGPVKYITIGVPRQALRERIPDPEALFLKPIPKHSEALRLLTGYLSLLDGTGAQLAPDTGSAFVTHVHDLCALVLAPARRTVEHAREGLRAARLHAIKRDILAYLGDVGLTLSAVAARQGISPRYVRMLFEPEDTTFSEFLLSERLARAYRILSDARYAGTPVSAIGYEAGFADLSYFNRCFRTRYGLTPSDVRAAARRENARK